MTTFPKNHWTIELYAMSILINIQIKEQHKWATVATKWIRAWFWVFAPIISTLDVLEPIFPVSWSYHLLHIVITHPPCWKSAFNLTADRVVLHPQEMERGKVTNVEYLRLLRSENRWISQIVIIKALMGENGCLCVQITSKSYEQ